jgi:hypothetical protein
MERQLATVPSIAGTAALTILCWKEFDAALVAPAWLVLAFALFEIGKWLKQPVLRAQAYVLLIASFGALLAINLYAIYPPGGSPLASRWDLVCFAAAAFYYMSGRLMLARDAGAYLPMERQLATVPSIAGTAALTILCWKQFDAIYVAPAWAILALVLIEGGTALRQANLLRQGHVIAALVFVRLFMANFVAPGEATLFVFGTEVALSHRLLTVLPVAALFYYLRATSIGPLNERVQAAPAIIIRNLYSYGAAVLLLALVRFEFGRAFAIIGMAPLALALFAIGRYIDDVHLRVQSYLLVVLTFARSWATNAYLIGEFYAVPERVATIVPCVLAFAVAAIVASQPIETKPIRRSGRLWRFLGFLERNASDFFAIVASLMAAILAYYELPNDLVTIAWGGEALLLVTIGLMANRRSLRLLGLALLLLSLLNLTLVVIIEAEPIYRIASYIVLGIILLVASLIYTRYRSVIDKYVRS